MLTAIRLASSRVSRFITSRRPQELFDSAGAMGDLLKTKELRAEIARFLHADKDDA